MLSPAVTGVPHSLCRLVGSLCACTQCWACSAAHEPEVGGDRQEHTPDASTLELGHGIVECRLPQRAFSRARLLEGIPGIAVMEEVAGRLRFDGLEAYR